MIVGNAGLRCTIIPDLPQNIGNIGGMEDKKNNCCLQLVVLELHTVVVGCDHVSNLALKPSERST